MLKDIWKGPKPASYPSSLTALGDVLYFAAPTTRHGRELWRSDGTQAGTLRVKDIDPGVRWSSPEGLTVSNGILYFSADDGIHGSELWRSDGSDAGTSLVKDIWPGPDRSFPDPNGPWYTPSPAIRDVAGTLFLGVNDGKHGWELWKSDGTTAGTVMVKDLWPGSGLGSTGRGRSQTSTGPCTSERPTPRTGRNSGGATARMPGP